MPTSALATVAALNALTIRGATPATPAESKDNFQALLDIGADAQAPQEDTRPAKVIHEDDKEIIAAPMSAAAEPVKLQTDDGDQDAHVRAYRNDATDRDYIADKNQNDRYPATKEPEVKSTASNDTKESVTEESAGAAKADVIPLTQEAPVDELQEPIAVLNQVLEALAVVIPPAQPIANLQAAGVADPIVLYKTNIADTENTIQPINGLEVTTGVEGDYSPKLALSDILSQIARIKSLLENAEEGEMPNITRAFRALIHDLREFSQYLHAHPEALKEMGDDKTAAILATRDLLRQYKLLIGSGPDVSDPHILKPSAIAKPDIFPGPMFKTAAGSEISAEPMPTQLHLTAASTAAITAAAAAQTGSDSQTNTGGNPNGGNPLPLQISSVKEANQNQAASAANATDFARLLQQAKMPVMEQVMVHIKTGLENGASKIEIKLEPEALGKVEIKMHVDANGKTGVSVTADNKNTLDLLQRDARGLEKALADAGLKADSGSLSFNLRGGQQEQNQDSLYAKPYRTALPDEIETAAAPALSRSYVVNLAQGLDITI